jgi:hypothetical protein
MELEFDSSECPTPNSESSSSSSFRKNELKKAGTPPRELKPKPKNKKKKPEKIKLVKFKREVSENMKPEKIKREDQEKMKLSMLKEAELIFNYEKNLNKEAFKEMYMMDEEARIEKEVNEVVAKIQIRIKKLKDENLKLKQLLSKFKNLVATKTTKGGEINITNTRTSRGKK